jgi:hypothetical protein
LVLCEDTKSCLTYLEDAARHFRAHAEVKIFHCGFTDPIGIVKEAIRQRRNFDQVFCAIDRDTHLGFDEALQMAKGADVQMIVSYPCYEYWILLHMLYSRAPVVRQGAQSAGDVMLRMIRACPELADYEKGGSRGLFDRLSDRLPGARQRAAQSLAEALGDVDAMNPSTRLHELIAVFEGLEHLKQA